jgi:hypothetical protein
MVHWWGRGRISKTKVLDSVGFFIMSSPLVEQSYWLNTSIKTWKLEMDNTEIRNRVLVRLYRKYYGIPLSSAIDAEQVVRYAAILSENSDLAYRNVNYLAQSSLIKEEKPLEEKILNAYQSRIMALIL